jgi:hypothetical protein
MHHQSLLPVDLALLVPYDLLLARQTQQMAVVLDDAVADGGLVHDNVVGERGVDFLERHRTWSPG